jgi:hypothetical protein
MPNYCDFGLRGNGPVQDIEGFASHWDSMLRDAKGGPDQNGFTTKILDYRTEYPVVDVEENVS